MTTRIASATALVVTLLLTSGLAARKKEFTDSFMIESCNFAAEGTNPYLNLTPGYQLVLESAPGKSKGGHVVLVSTVLDETEQVDGVTTRVVEERETEDGKLTEVSRNFFALCKPTNSVFYFGEDVDDYDDTGTMVVDHDGAWRAGVAGARPGIIMPGTVLLGARYFQEVAPDVALDRAEIVSLSEVVETPAGTFQGCLHTRETSALERGKSFKSYAPGIGLVRDDDLLLTRSGAVSR
ncbi:MAG TPA: hypothetical protein VKA21_02695 [Candidatus Binatia bacterium]|nr:hypothetical protein [Candidatus Binatia bacterium]